MVIGPKTHPRYALPDGFWEQSPRTEKHSWIDRKDGLKRASLCLVEASNKEDWHECAVLYMIMSLWYTHHGDESMATLMEQHSDLCREKTHRPGKSQKTVGRGPSGC